jgi:hypothetical protein
VAEDEFKRSDRMLVEDYWEGEKQGNRYKLQLTISGVEKNGTLDIRNPRGGQAGVMENPRVTTDIEKDHKRFR